MGSLLCSLKKKIKTKRPIQISESRTVNWKPRLNLNLTFYLSEFLNFKDLIEFAYTNKYYLRIKDKYLQKIERFKITSSVNSCENEKFSLKVLSTDSKLFTGLKFLDISHYGIKEEFLNFPMNNLHELTIDFCHYESRFNFNFSEEFLEKIFSSNNLEKLVINNSMYFIRFEELFFHLKNRDSFKHLILINSIEFYNYHKLRYLELDGLFNIKNLETLDLSENDLDFNGSDILNNFHKLKNLKVLRLRKCRMNLEKYLIVDIIKNTSHNLELLDISENFYYYKNPSNIRRIHFNNDNEHDREIICNSDWDLISDLLKERNNSGSAEFKIIHNNLKGINKDRVFITRMLFSRSGIHTESSSKESGKTSKILGKFMGRKPNGAILPQLIYNSTSKIEFTKEMLIEILRIENKIRLSDKAKDLYDINKREELTVHLRMDQEMIKSALKSFGYNPDEDDSMKAYHLATSKFIHDEEVRNSVVWMKYDKCKIGNYTLEYRLNFDGIKLYDLDEKVCFLKDLISINRPNLIVSGSMS
jgi:hypothetical protein